MPLIQQLAGPTLAVKDMAALLGAILDKSGVVGRHAACRPKGLVSPCSTS